MAIKTFVFSIFFCGSDASSSNDAKMLKDVWKGLEASVAATSPVSSPLKKTLGVYRTLLTSLEEFRSELNYPEAGGETASLDRRELVDPFETNADNFGRHAWAQGPMGGIWPQESYENGRLAAAKAWTNAGDAAAYARVSANDRGRRKESEGGDSTTTTTPPLTPRQQQQRQRRDFDLASAAVVPVRVDLVAVGLQGEGLHGMDLSSGALDAWFENLASALPLSSLVPTPTSAAVTFKYEFRLVGVSALVCGALEKYLQRHLIRPPAATANQNQLNGNSRNELRGLHRNGAATSTPPPPPPSPYVLTWRMEALLGDLAVAISDADSEVRRRQQKASRDENDDDADDDGGDGGGGEQGAGGYGVAGPALTLFVLNPRRTFVSNYNHETYGYRSGLGFHEMSALMKANRTLLDEALVNEQASVDSWRHQTHHHKQDLGGGSGGGSRGGKGGGGNNGGGGNDDEGEEEEEGGERNFYQKRDWASEYANEQDLVFTESTLSQDGSGSADDFLSDDFRSLSEDSGPVGTAKAWSNGRRRVRSLDASHKTEQWAAALLEALGSDEKAARTEPREEREEGGKEAGNRTISAGTNAFPADRRRDRSSAASATRERASQELADLTAGNVVRWRSSQAFVERAAAGSGNQNKVNQDQQQYDGYNGVSGGRRRRRVVLRDLLAHARVEALTGQSAGRDNAAARHLEPCLTDVWLASPFPASSPEAYPSVAKPDKVALHKLSSRGGGGGSLFSNTLPSDSNKNKEADDGNRRRRRRSKRAHKASLLSQRIAFLDLAAGPFHWGPTVGGRGVRTRDTLPRASLPTQQQQQQQQQGTASDNELRTGGGRASSSSSGGGGVGKRRGLGGDLFEGVDELGRAKVKRLAVAAQKAEVAAYKATALAVEAKRAILVKAADSAQSQKSKRKRRRQKTYGAAGNAAAAAGNAAGNADKDEDDGAEAAALVLDQRARELGLVAEVRGLEEFVGKRVVRLEHLHKHMGCRDEQKAAARKVSSSAAAAAAAASSASASASSGSAESASGEDLNHNQQALCSVLAAEVALLRQFDKSAEKLARYGSELGEGLAAAGAETSQQAARAKKQQQQQQPQQTSFAVSGDLEGELHQSYSDMLKSLHALVAPIDTNDDRQPTTNGAGNGYGGTGNKLNQRLLLRQHADFLNKLGSVVMALGAQVLTPPSVGPLLLPPSEAYDDLNSALPLSALSPRYYSWLPHPLVPPVTSLVAGQRQQQADRATNANANAAALSSALSHAFPESFVVDLFVVRDHDHYDPLDVASGGVDLAAIKEALFSMAQPLNQALSFTVHSVRASEDPSLAAALAAATTAAATPLLDPTTGTLLPTVTRCVDTASLRKSLRAIDRRESSGGEGNGKEETVGSGGGLGGGGGASPPRHHHFDLYSSYSPPPPPSSSPPSSLPHAVKASTLPPVASTAVHVPLFLLSLQHATLLDCDPESSSSSSSSSEPRGNPAAAFGDSVSEALAVGPTVAKPSSEQGGGRRRRRHRHHGEASMSASVAASSSPEKRRRLQAQEVKRALDMVIAVQSPATYEPLSGFSCGLGPNRLSRPVPRSPRNPTRALIAAASTLLGLVPPNNALVPAPLPLAAKSAAADAAAREGREVGVEHHWLFSACDLPTASLARHPVVGPLAADAIARTHIAQVLAASLTIDRAVVTLLENTPTTSTTDTPTTSSESPSSSWSVLPALPLTFTVHQSLYEMRRLLARTTRRRKVVQGLAARLDFKAAARHLNVLLTDSRDAYRSALAVSRAHAQHTCSLATAAAASSGTASSAAHLAGDKVESGANLGDGSRLPFFQFFPHSLSQSRRTTQEGPWALSFASAVGGFLKLLTAAAAALGLAAIAVVAVSQRLRGDSSGGGGSREPASPAGGALRGGGNLFSKVLRAMTTAGEQVEKVFLRYVAGGTSRPKPKVN